VADKLAKESSKKQQPKSKLSYREVQTLIKNKRLADFKLKTGGKNQRQDALHQLERHKQTVILRLRTGHCRVRNHMKKIVIADFCCGGLSINFELSVPSECKQLLKTLEEF